MPRRVNLAMLLGLITVSVLSFGLTAGAQEEEVGTTDEVTQAQETLAQMRIDQERAAEEYNAAASTLQGLNGDITNTTRELEAAEERLAEAEAKLSSRAGEIYKQGNVAFAEYLLDSQSASDFANRLDLVARLLIAERDEVAQLRAVRDELEAEAETRRQQVQNYEQTTAEMEARWDKASALETEMEDYLASLNEAVLAEIEAEREAQAQAAAEEAESLLRAAQEMDAQRAAEAAAAAAQEAQEALEAAETEQERQQAQAEAQQALDAAEEAERKAAEEASRRAAADEQAALRAEQMKAQQAAEEDAANYAIAAEEARKAIEAAETEQERQQAQAEAQQAEAAARDQARKAAEAEQAKQDAEKALAEEQQKAQPAGTQPTPTLGATGSQPTPTLGATENQPTPNADGQPAPNQSAAGPPAASGSAGADPVAEGMKAMGVPYVLGGEDLNGMDCTGFVLWAYRGIMALPHSIEGQAASGPQVSGPPQPGDILIWPGYHVAMATGNGMMAHASNYHMKVVHVPITDMEPYSYAVRPAR